ncbi:MAG: lysophospholipid acyltransferase family protein [Acidimicrobiales bacterium]
MSLLPPALRNMGFPYRAPSTPRGVAPVPAPKRTGVDFETDWARRAPARLGRTVLHELVMGPVVRLAANPSVRGRDRLEGVEGPVIFVANHHSHVDTPLLLRSIPPRFADKVFVGAAADYFFGARLTGALSAFALNAIPIERTRVSRRSALSAAALIDDGWSMIIFPEGGRSPDGWGQPFRGGAAYLSVRCGAPVAPVHLAGTGAILGKGMRVPKPAATTVSFGELLWPAPEEDTRTLSARIERAVAALADEEATDWWQARRRLHRGETPALTGPQAPSWRRSWARSSKRSGPARRRRAWPQLS